MTMIDEYVAANWSTLHSLSRISGIASRPKQRLDRAELLECQKPDSGRMADACCYTACTMRIVAPMKPSSETSKGPIIHQSIRRVFGCTRTSLSIKPPQEDRTRRWGGREGPNVDHQTLTHDCPAPRSNCLAQYRSPKCGTVQDCSLFHLGKAFWLVRDSQPHDLHSSPSEPFTPVACAGRLFMSRLRGRAVQRTSHDSKEFGAFCFGGRSARDRSTGDGHSEPRQ